LPLPPCRHFRHFRIISSLSQFRHYADISPLPRQLFDAASRHRQLRLLSFTPPRLPLTPPMSRRHAAFSFRFSPPFAPMLFHISPPIRQPPRFRRCRLPPPAGRRQMRRCR
jgi:hypothetical protein